MSHIAARDPAAPRETGSATASWASVNGIRLHLLEAGPADGAPVVLLHGFPEFSYSWRRQIPFLATAGFRVIAPDLRGYNLSDKPKCVRDYRIDALVADVIALIEQHAGGKAVLVGHDWGGVIAWFTAMWHPDRVEKLVILNAPHPVAFLRELRRPSQLLRSWYVFFFQLPGLPELLIRMNDFAAARTLFQEGPARHSIGRQRDVRRYIQAIAQPGALSATINYYRAAMRIRPLSTLRRILPVHVPTLLIWGSPDRYLSTRLTLGLERWAPNLQVEHLSEATHWVQNDQPERVNSLLQNFLSGAAAGR